LHWQLQRGRELQRRVSRYGCKVSWRFCVIEGLESLHHSRIIKFHQQVAALPYPSRGTGKPGIRIDHPCGPGRRRPTAQEEVVALIAGINQLELFSYFGARGLARMEER